MTTPSPPSASARTRQEAPRLTLPQRLRLFRGALRRLLLILFRPSVVRAQLAARTGACSRCGACCHLVNGRCLWLRDLPDGHSGCRLYKIGRPPNCHAFPIDARDLADRNLINPSAPCGYAWHNAPDADAACIPRSGW